MRNEKYDIDEILIIEEKWFRIFSELKFIRTRRSSREYKNYDRGSQYLRSYDIVYNFSDSTWKNWFSSSRSMISKTNIVFDMEITSQIIDHYKISFVSILLWVMSLRVTLNRKIQKWISDLFEKKWRR